MGTAFSDGEIAPPGEEQTLRKPSGGLRSFLTDAARGSLLTRVDTHASDLLPLRPLAALKEPFWTI